jgi:large subunit ribosomal protein L9
VAATPHAISEYDTKRAAHMAKQEDTKKANQTIATTIQCKSVKLQAKSNPEGTLFGSLSNEAILQAIKDQYKVEVPAQAIQMEAIKKTGTHSVTVVLPEIAPVQLNVVVEASNE